MTNFIASEKTCFIAPPTPPAREPAPAPGVFFRFLDLSPEIRNKIYELVLKFDRPVYLSRARDVYDKYTNDHTNRCPFKLHSILNHPVPGNEDNEFSMWCLNPFNNTKRKLMMPRSVLTLRHVCKQIDSEMRYTFFAINEFHFVDAVYACAIFEMMANRELLSAITELGFAFCSKNATTIYPALAAACPNVRVLKVVIDYLDHRVMLKSGSNRSLKKARGMSMFGKFVAGLKELERIELVGRDFVDSEVVNGRVMQTQVDINHPQAVGGWIREEIEKARRARATGEGDEQRPNKKAKVTAKPAPKIK